MSLRKLKRINDYEKTLPVLELYTAVQSEGSRQGYPTIVVRTTGCTHRCYFGSPTMHPALVNELTHFANERQIFITMETEGSHFLNTDYPINLLSISPKFSNSIPVMGAVTPTGQEVDERMIKKHNSKRCNIEAIRQSIEYHDDYHIKPVLDKDLSMVKEVEELIKELNIPDHKIWAMPAGDDRESLFQSYGPVMNFVRDRGWRYTGRSHIMAFNTERCV